MPLPPRRDTSDASATFGVREAADLVGVAPSRIRTWVRRGLLAPGRCEGGPLRLAFQDLVLLRHLRDLSEARVPPRRIRRALERLRAGLPEDRPMSGLRLSARAGEVVVREGERLWTAESGQYVFDFERDEPASAVVALERAHGSGADERGVEEWYLLGCELEDVDRERARDCYRRALELEPDHAESHVNLGCLDHEDGKLEDALAHYRAGLASAPDDLTAAFDLAVVLGDLGRDGEARAAYEAVLRADPDCADAHHNLARLCERLGDATGVVRHLRAYQKLTR